MPTLPPKISIGPFHFTSVAWAIFRQAGAAGVEGAFASLRCGANVRGLGDRDLLNAGEDRFGESFSQCVRGAAVAEM